MLLHKKCNSKVTLDLSPALKFISAFGFTSKGLRVSMVTMSKLRNGGKTNFLCPSCECEIPVSEIVVLCQQCGKTVDISVSRLPRNSGGVVCGNCAELYYDSDTDPLNVSNFEISKDALR